MDRGLDWGVDLGSAVAGGVGGVGGVGDTVSAPGLSSEAGIGEPFICLV